jgi:branched-chain amino acid transport system permease protein
LVVLSGALLGVIIDRVVRKLIDAPHVSVIIATVGISISIKAIVRLTAGTHPKPFPQVFPMKPIALGPVMMPLQGIWFIAVLAVSVAIFYLFFFKTQTGLSMRAVSQNRNAAWLMGINVPLVFLLAWAIGGGMGALGGLLFAPIVMVNPDIGMYLLMPAFSAAVIGGFGSLPGVLVGGWIIGIAENVIGVFIGSDVKEFVPFVFLFLFLVIKPTGLFHGER